MGELRENIAWKALYKMVTFDHRRMDIEQLIYEYADQILTLIKEAGYRKVSGDPPVLNKEEIEKITPYGLVTYMPEYRKIAQAQRDADVLFYSKWGR